MRGWMLMMSVATSLLSSASRADEPTTAPVLVQLFTSEGCSSCPPADQLLHEFLAKPPVDGVTIVPMSLHVDYWNHLGWADAYSARQFSDYQRQYRDAMRATQIYTPQMIVDGRTAFVGSDRAAARKSIEDAAKLPKVRLSLRLSAPEHDGSKIRVEIDVQHGDALPADQAFTLMLAVTEDDLTSDVRRGENAGRKLHHDAVVRLLRSVGDIRKDGGSAPFQVDLPLDPQWHRGRLHVVAFVQSKQDLRVYSVASVKCPSLKQ
jgi:hypothetical protein